MIEKVQAVYRHEGGYDLIELKLREVRDLFDRLDPSPFRQKDLNATASEYIVDAVRELGPRRALKLYVYLPEADLAMAQSHGVDTAIGNYFAYRAERTALELKRLLFRGLISMVIALAFMSICLLTRQAIHGLSSGVTTIVEEGLLILGWVAMWRPIEIFLYDWWPLLQQKRVFARAAQMPIQIFASPAAQQPIA